MTCGLWLVKLLTLLALVTCGWSQVTSHKSLLTTHSSPLSTLHSSLVSPHSPVFTQHSSLPSYHSQFTTHQPGRKGEFREVLTKRCEGLGGRRCVKLRKQQRNWDRVGRVGGLVVMLEYKLELLPTKPTLVEITCGSVIGSCSPFG